MLCLGLQKIMLLGDKLCLPCHANDILCSFLNKFGYLKWIFLHRALIIITTVGSGVSLICPMYSNTIVEVCHFKRAPCVWLSAGEHLVTINICKVNGEDRNMLQVIWEPPMNAYIYIYIYICLCHSEYEQCCGWPV